jgi:hypothetical protein
MSFQYLPELEWRFGYLLVLIAVICLVLYRAFRRRGGWRYHGFNAKRHLLALLRQSAVSNRPVGG